MTVYNPFDAQPEPVQTVPDNPVSADAGNPRPTAVNGDGKVVITLKGGTGYDEPWVVIHAESVEDALAHFDDHEKLTQLLDRTKKAAGYFHGLSGGGAAPAQSAPAQTPAYQQPPADAPECPGPGWEFKSGFSKKNNKTWKAWMPPKGSNEPPVFFN